MKIGILTFHSQLNYGGVLQCWALQMAIESLGHEVVVLDRWLDAENASLRGESARGVKSVVLRLLDLFLLNGVAQTHRRRIKTHKFIAEHLNLSDYHFYRWSEAPNDLGIEVLVVGSDQVWNGFGAKEPGPYLLEDAPHIRAISYAASLGMTEIPPEKTYRYKNAMSRFEKVSVREKSARDLLSDFRDDIDKVADPVALLTREDWNRAIPALNVGPAGGGSLLVCYLISVNIADIYDSVLSFADRKDSVVEIYLNSSMGLRGLPLGRKLRSMLGGRVKFRLDAGPVDFLLSLQRANWVLTDSFHAAMFSAIFSKNIRVISPKDGVRKAMFSRIEELQDMLDAPCDFIVSDAESAFRSFMKGKGTSFSQSGLKRQRDRSLKWLKDALTVGNSVKRR